MSDNSVSEFAPANRRPTSRAVPIQQSEAHDDPGLDPVEQARRRTHDLVNSMSDAARGQLTEMRDRVDDLMRAIDARNSALEDKINDHAQFAAATIQCKVIIGEALENLRGWTAPMPGKTLTQK